MMNYIQGGGLNKTTDRDQWSWLFLNDPQNTLSLTEKPKKHFLKSKTRNLDTQVMHLPDSQVSHLCSV